jgi:hypothetical protein
MINNADWLRSINYLEFLRDVGRHFSVNRMLSFDSVKMRLDREQSLSFLEFNYMILQAYDFVVLNERYDCRLQMGGSDQWGNIVNGIDLGHRLGTPQLYALTSPLLTTSSGAKMGKSATGAIWLNPEMLPAYDFWQYWRNTEDADVGRFLKLYTILPMDEIARLSALGGSEINEVKKILATEVTAILHGRQAADYRGPCIGSRCRYRGALGIRAGGAGRVQRRNAPSRQRRSGARERRAGLGRAHDAGRNDAAGRRHQAFARQEETRSRQARLNAQRNSKIWRKTPGAITDSGLTVIFGFFMSPSSM